MRDFRLTALSDSSRFPSEFRGIAHVQEHATNHENETAEIAEIAESPICSLRSPRPLRLFSEESPMCCHTPRRMKMDHRRDACATLFSREEGIFALSNMVSFERFAGRMLVLVWRC
jgi:hypothetical protein